MDDHEIIGTTLPHSEFGAPDCCGCLNGIIRGDQSEVICNECNAVVKTVSASDLQRTLDEMELSLDLATTRCPHCGAIHVAPGFSELIAFVCDKCGEPVKPKEDPNTERLFSG